MQNTSTFKDRATSKKEEPNPDSLLERLTTTVESIKSSTIISNQ